MTKQKERHSDLLTNKYSTKAFYGLPVFFGSSLPGDSHGSNYPWDLYEKDSIGRVLPKRRVKLN